MRIWGSRALGCSLAAFVFGALAAAGLAQEQPAQPDAGSEQRDPAEEAAAEAMRGVFRWLLGRGETPGSPDQVDARAPHNAQRELLLDAAAQAIEAQDWKQAVRILQRLLDFPDDSQFRTRSGRWDSMRDEANRLLGRAPAGVLDVYRAQYGGLARQTLEQAAATRQLPLYVDVATRFFHTKAGYEAANLLGSVHLNRGEFGLAARWFALLLEAGAACTAESAWQLKAAFAFERAGRSEAAAQLLQRLAAEHQGRVEIGGGRIAPADWLGSVDAGGRPQTPVLDEWRQLYGTPSRTGVSTGGPPLLLPESSLPYTHSHSVGNQIEELLQDLVDRGRAPIPAANLLAVEGKVAFRNLRGVQVVDAASGRPLWETDAPITAEELLTGRTAQMGNRFNRFNIPVGVAAGGHPGEADFHPLTGLLFRNGVFGLISSDGRQLFVIEDQGILSRQQPGVRSDTGRTDTLGTDWSCNRLTAYDLDSGHHRWSIGGEESEEPFRLPLSGRYFYGPPAIDGDDCYVVGGIDDEVHLYALDRASGRPRWSQLIAYSDTKIERDIVRRWWPAQVAAANGVLVCPTTVGWLVGVDRLRHTVLWAYRYSDSAGGRGRESQLLAVEELNDRWAPAAPVITRNSVVFTPPEEPLIVCLRLDDGRRRWQRPQGDGIYLAGVFDEHVLIVGRESVQSLALADGRTEWSRAIDHPSGRGAAAGGDYYLPLRNGTLQRIEIATGEVRDRYELPRGRPPLGNLAFYRDKLYSLSVQGLNSFQQNAALLAEIDRRKLQNPTDPRAMVMEAQIELLERDYEAALDRLHAASSGDVAPELREVYHRTLVDSLSGAVRNGGPNRRARLRELEAVAETPAERLRHQRLRAELLADEGNAEAAFRVFAALGSESTQSTFAPPDDPARKIRGDVWAAGRMRDMWQTLSAPARERLYDEVAAAAQSALAGGLDTALAFVERYRFHDGAEPWAWELVERFQTAERFAEAEQLLLRLRQRPGTGDRAEQRLARLRREFGLTPGEPAPAPEWLDGKLRSIQSGISYSPPAQELLIDSPLPFFGRHRLDVEQRSQRLAVVNVARQEYAWLAPLRSASRNSDGGYVTSLAVGHRLFMLSGNVLHAFSPAEQRLLWTKTLPDGGRARQLHPATRPHDLPMAGADRSPKSAWQDRVAARGRLAAANEEYVGCYGRHEFTVYDSDTGEFCWSRAISPETTVVGGPGVVYLYDPANDDAQALRSFDGRPVAAPQLAELLEHTVDLVGDDLLLVETTRRSGFFGLGRAQTTCRLHDPIEEGDLWSRKLESGSRISLLPSGKLLAVSPGGDVALIDVQTGDARDFESAGAQVRSAASVYALADDESLFLVVNHDHSSATFAESLPSIPAHGEVLAYDLASGGRRWSRKVEDHNLVVAHFRHTPLLLFVSRSWRQKGNVHYSELSLLALNKRSGDSLYETRTPSQYSGFHSTNVNLVERYMELTSYNQRLRLVPDDQPDAE